MKPGFFACGTAVLLFCGVALDGSEYFVAPDGDDARDGRTRATAFATIQRGVDALATGDTLTIAPGEYRGGVRREDLGGMEAETILRAEVPGTVVLRGDAPAPVFEPLERHRFVYVASLDEEPKAVFDHRLLHTLRPKINVSELEFAPGFFHYNELERQLYISNLDLRPPDGRLYTLSHGEANGLELIRPRRVVIEGLVLTGFHPGHGIFLGEPVDCEVRDCVVSYNTAGIMLSPVEGLDGKDGGRGNLVRDCVAFGNTFGGIVRYGAADDVVENCILYSNVTEGSEHFGVMHYGPMRGPLLIRGNTSWGHNFDYSVKPGRQHERVEGNVALGFIRIAPMFHNLVGGGNEYDRRREAPADNILLLREENLDPDFEFADPLNLDFRLQSDSRFRASGPDGVDRGPHPFAADVFYVSPSGDDANDGLSMRSAWREPVSALTRLRPGDTLYIAGGTYSGGDWSAPDAASASIHIRGRGREPVVFTSPLAVRGGVGMVFERLDFQQGVRLFESKEVEFAHCTFAGTGGGVAADGVENLRITHSLFADAPIRLSGAEGVFLASNVFANEAGPVLAADRLEALAYSDYNVYGDAMRAWQVGNRVFSLEDLRPGHEAHSVEADGLLAEGASPPRLHEAWRFENAGLQGKPAGPHPRHRVESETLEIHGPFVHSVSDTTANLEWWTSLPATFEIAWGDTPEMRNSARGVEGLERFHSFSLTGLEPGRTYYFGIRAARANLPPDSARTPPEAEPGADGVVEFTTAPNAVEPRTLYVSPEGNDGNDGLQPERALRTVGRAAELAGPGDTILIGGGTYNETVRIRATGTPERPITFQAVPGERPVFSGATLQQAFVATDKSDLRFDGLYFADFNQGGNVFVLRRSPRVGITRGMNVTVEAHRCPELEVENCVVRMGQWTFYNLVLRDSPNSRIENNVFVMTILEHLSISGSPGTVVRRNIFCENLRNKSHHTLVAISGEVSESENCFYMRWPEDEKPAVNGRPLTEYRARSGSDALAANPMMPGVPGWSRGWQQSPGEDFKDFFTANPELIVRGIGLQPGAFTDFKKDDGEWPYDRAWAEQVLAAMDSAGSLQRAGRSAEALEQWLRLVENTPLPPLLKAEFLKQASRCAEETGDLEQAMELAERMEQGTQRHLDPTAPLAVRRRMELLLEQGRHAELLERYGGDIMLFQTWRYPQMEDVMADLYYFRALALLEAGDLKAAEENLRFMNDKRERKQYRAGESIHDLVWLRVGDFYRDVLKDEERALEAYLAVLDRTTWTFWGRPPKPAARGGDENLLRAEQAAAEILRARGGQDHIADLRRAVVVAKVNAAAALLDEDALLAGLAEIADPANGGGRRLQVAMEKIQAMEQGRRREILNGLAGQVEDLSEDARELLVRMGSGSNDPGRDDALRGLILLAPADAFSEAGDGVK